MATHPGGVDTLDPIGHSDSARSAVTWAAVFAGAVVALATTLVLFALGSGLGLAAASPWPGAGPAATTFAIGAGIWLIVMQWLSAAVGGYITGRLRTRWVGVHTHEVFFRDTAHGLLAWALATIAVAAVALSATSSTLAAASATTNAAGYASDVMLRSDGAGSAAANAEVARLLGREGPMTADDHAYLVRVVQRNTGVSEPEAERRVDAATTSLRAAADKARKTSSAFALFTALSMLIGAFIAAVAAAYAGSLRDDVDGHAMRPGHR
ncbi:MAG: hypothetical protein KGM17_12900 [Sphingomonadales bacterium]|nr:hypothetical protein [Sphingomonadales bacterium]